MTSVWATALATALILFNATSIWANENNQAMKL